MRTPTTPPVIESPILPSSEEVSAWLDKGKPQCVGGHSVPSFDGWSNEQLSGAYRMLGILGTSPRIRGQGLALLRCLSLQVVKAYEARIR